MSRSIKSARTFLGAATAAVLVLALAGCFAPGGPGADPAALGHAKWCEQNPPSGYCVVGEPH